MSPPDRELIIYFPQVCDARILKEIHRVLKTNAVFGMIWNIEDCR